VRNRQRGSQRTYSTTTGVVHQPQFPNTTPPDTPELIAPTPTLTVRVKYVMVFVIGSETDTSRSSRKATKKRRTFKNRSMIAFVVKMGEREESKKELAAAQ
jgi:hypothetical protein